MSVYSLFTNTHNIIAFYYNVQINGGSIAEHAGLQADDIITEINGSKVTNLTHSEVQKQILQSGNDLSFAVLR